MARLSQPGARPLLACEISAGSVIAARCSRKPPHVEMFTSRSLRPGVITPGLAGANVQDASALRTAIQDTLGPLSGKSKDVIAIIPDAAIRIMLLDFESLPVKPQERGPFIRFRLKKSLPFDVDHAAVSWDVQSSNGNIQVVAAVSPNSVIGEYEAAFRDAGYSPGVVLPSSLASLGTVDAQRPTLLLKIDPLNITIAAVETSALRLIRTLDNPLGYEVTAAELTEAVLPSVVFFEDTSGTRIEQILVCGAASFREIAPVLQQQTGAGVQELLPKDSGQNLSGDKIPPSLMAGVVGALLG
jgi:type IV pilus assembly protein PilM